MKTFTKIYLIIIRFLIRTLFGFTQNLLMKRKIDLLVKYFNDPRYVDDPDLAILDKLDELRKKVYAENRIKLGFGMASNMATKSVIESILL